LAVAHEDPAGADGGVHALGVGGIDQSEIRSWPERGRCGRIHQNAVGQLAGGDFAGVEAQQAEAVEGGGAVDFGGEQAVGSRVLTLASRRRCASRRTCRSGCWSWRRRCPGRSAGPPRGRPGR
jgi:hypothetical protein